MRAPLIAVILIIGSAAGYYFYQRNSELPGAAAAQTLSASPPSDGAALSIFSDVCIDGRASFTETERRAVAAGWARAPDNVHPNIARVMAISRSAEIPQATDVVMYAYARADTPQFIILTGMNLGSRPVNGCYVYDFGATSLPDLGALGASLGPPGERIDEPEVAIYRKWVGPTALPNVATLRVGYFPPGSPAEEQLGFNGLLFALTSMSQ